jgi:hypothetical protein
MQRLCRRIRPNSILGSADKSTSEIAWIERPEVVERLPYPDQLHW